MKRFTLLVFASLFSIAAFSQLNMSYISDLDYQSDLSDVWGYAAPDGTEYALVGLFTGVSVVSLADPANPVEADFVPGPGSGWRDIKTWGDHAYVINETGSGLLVIDLTTLPDSVTYSYWAPDIPGLGTLGSCHNLWIDELGYAYLTGCSLNGGGLLFVDVFSDPGNPIYAGKGDPEYSHDVYVRNNLAFSAEINLGEFGVYDVTDKSNPVFLASQETPASTTHNLWLSDDSNILFTTDETGNAPVAAYDVSDLNDIKELDQFRPIETLGTGVIPHNVHVWNDFLIISYYTDGCILVDASKPSNLIEVGNFDTFIPANTGFSGAWGAYPYLPSGLVLVSDIGDGLYVLEPNYIRACYLEGKVTDVSSGAGLFGASIKILGENAFEESDFLGGYATGLATAGTYQVEVSKAGYLSKTVMADLMNEVTTELNVALEPLPSFSLSGIVRDAETGLGIPAAKVLVYNDDFEFDMEADANGNFTIASVFEGTYEVVAGKWGYKTGFLAASDLNENNNSVELELETGIEDVFSLDLGWTVDDSAQSGNFELGNPIGINPGQGVPFLIQPEDDVVEDPGNSCYITGNISDLFGGVQLTGTTKITSPIFDLTGMNEPTISFYTWIFTANIDGNVPLPGNDPLKARLSNGIVTVGIGNYFYASILVGPEWTLREITVLNELEPTANMQISFEIGDVDNYFEDIAEAGVDFFRAYDANPTNTNEVVDENLSMSVYPNPSSDEFNVKYELDDWNEEANFEIFNGLGQIVKRQKINSQSGLVQLGKYFNKGLYLIRINNDGNVSESIRLIKQ